MDNIPATKRTIPSPASSGSSTHHNHDQRAVTPTTGRSRADRVGIGMSSAMIYCQMSVSVQLESGPECFRQAPCACCKATRARALVLRIPAMVLVRNENTRSLARDFSHRAARQRRHQLMLAQRLFQRVFMISVWRAEPCVNGPTPLPALQDCARSGRPEFGHALSRNSIISRNFRRVDMQKAEGGRPRMFHRQMHITALSLQRVKKNRVFRLSRNLSEDVDGFGFEGV